MAKKSNKRKKSEIADSKRLRQNLYNKKSRLKKKLESAPKRKQASIRKEMQTVTNQIIGKTRSINRLKSPAVSTVIQKKPRLVARAQEKAPRVSKKKQNDIRKERQRQYNRRYRIKQQLEKATTQKEKDRLNRQLLGVASKVNELNTELGLIPAMVEVPEDKISITDGVQEEILAVWEARLRLTELLKGKIFKTYQLGDETYKRTQVPYILNAFADLEQAAYTSGTSTPYVVFELHFTEKLVIIYVRS